MTDLRPAPWGLTVLMRKYREHYYGVKGEEPMLVHQDTYLTYRISQVILLTFIMVWILRCMT